MPRLTSSSAARNKEPILSLLRTVASGKMNALEIASGSGEHVFYFAQALPDVIWQPSDIDPERLSSIDAWRRDHVGDNIKPAIALDAGQAGWAQTQDPNDLALLINLLHLISQPQTEAVLEGIAQVLRPGGTAFIYGPFLRDGTATSDGDAAFNAQIKASTPDAGYKDIDDICSYLQSLELSTARHDMPANNIAIIAQK